MTHVITFISNNLARLIAAVIIFITALLSWGCAPVKEYYPVYKDVYIPLKCTVNSPHKPMFNINAVNNNLAILQYAEELEAVLKSCTNH